jgi:hypothetical protein
MATLKHDDPEILAKRMYWLAWKACGPAQGMGVLQERDGVTEDDVWARIRGGGHDNSNETTRLGRLYADYIFGRMMKCDVRVEEGEVCFPSHADAVTPDYQDWALTYPTYTDLASAAVADLMGYRDSGVSGP